MWPKMPNGTDSAEAAKARAEVEADVGGLVGLFEGAVEKHRRDKARRLSTVSDLSAAAKARRRSSIVGGGMKCTFTNVSQSPAVLIVAVEAPAGLVLEHVHRSLMMILSRPGSAPTRIALK